ncbi:MAG TPA: cbb3-type cytochrome c oxidase subunit II, partial [Chthoniobacterales bacterium]|nr:cbb3-type cytochrome c oxidase subunit II [Chthoniobacterales bacterium]
MKGLASLILGIFGTFSFSWLGLILVPNYQIGHLNPQMDEEGTDVYPTPKSGMAERGRRVYVANGCYYCHSEQVRPDYAAGDIDRKWGDRRSAPRDYIFDRPVLLGKERMGPDLSNVGKRAPAEGEAPNAANAAITAAPGGGSPAPPAPPAGGAPAQPKTPPAGSPAQSPAAAPQTPPNAPARPAASPPAQNPPPAAAGSPAQSPAATSAPAAANAPPPPPAAALSPSVNPPTGEPLPYSAAWHHRHLYAPRSVTLDSNMPAFRFLYEKRPSGSEPAANAVQLTATDAPPVGWEVVPTYDAECLVAYLMSLDQSHPLKEVKSAG